MARRPFDELDEDDDPEPGTGWDDQDDLDDEDEDDWDEEDDEEWDEEPDDEF
jgi:hypothetical protein